MALTPISNKIGRETNIKRERKKRHRKTEKEREREEREINR